MGRTLGTIIQIAAAAAVFVTTGNIALAAATYQATGALNSLIGLGPRAPKPDTASTAIKVPRPPRVSAYGTSKLFGAYCLYETAENGTAVDVYAVHDGKMDGIVAHYLDNEQVTVAGNVVQEGDDGRYRGSAVNFYVTDGSAIGTAFAAIVALLPGIWTSAHRGDGVVAIGLTAKSVKAKNYQETYPSSTVPVPAIAARWQLCPDPAAPDPTNEAAWTWTENPVRQLMHYKMVREGVDYASKIAPTLAFWIEAAADCDAARALKAGGSEARYRSCVQHKHVDQHKDVVGNLLSTFDGWIAPRSDGALVVYAGKYVEPGEDDTIGPDEIVSYTWDGAGIDDDKAVNELVCSYVSAEHEYNTVECDSWLDEGDILERGQVLSQPLEVQVPSHAQARYLAKRKMARLMAPDRGTVTTNVAGRRIRGKRYISLHIEEAGTVFYSGPAEIIALSRNISTGGVTFSWVAADPNIDAWNPATEEGEPAAKGDRVAPQPLTAPTISTASAIYEGGGIRIELVVDSPGRDDLTWFVHWRVQGQPTWGPDQSYPDAATGATVTLVTGLVPADEMIEVQAAYQVGNGRVSAWSATETVSTSTAALAPSAPTEVNATGAVGEADVTWRNPTSANLSYVKVFRNTVSDFGTAAAITGELVGGLGEVMSITDSGLTAGTYYYWVVAYNAGDIASVPGGPASATVT